MESKIIPFYCPEDKWIVKSCDCILYDSDGKQYIDFESGVWCANLGHSNDRIVKLMESQIKESIHQGYKFCNHSAESLSEELQELIGFENGASVFLSSGSEAINMAVTLSQHFSGRKKIVKTDHSYLSAYGHGQISPDNENMVSVRLNDMQSIEDIDFKEIAAFVVETGGASFGVVKFPDNDFINRVAELCIENNCLIIADEVTTGMGRMGKWFGFKYYDLLPDMVVTGKALGNGYPVSAVTVSSKVLEGFAQNPFRYAQSHQNDPLGCAIGLEVIKTIRENDLINTCLKTGQYFSGQLELLKEKHPDKIKEVRARGLMLALELNDGTDGEVISGKLFQSGFVVGYRNNVLRFLPPFTIQTREINQLIETIDTLLTD